jgi:hypothetical protein
MEVIRNRHDSIRISTIQLAVVLSLLLHALFLWQVAPRVDLGAPGRPSGERGDGPLVVQITPEPPSRLRTEPKPPAPAQRAEPQTAAPRPPAPATPPAPQPKREPPPKVAQRPATPPRIAADKPAAPAAPAVPPPAPTPAPQRAPPSTATPGDFAADLEARRRAREERQQIASAEVISNTPRVDEEEERRKQIVANNLGLGRQPTYGAPRQGGGLFTIERVGLNDAEFTFFGWNSDIGRRSLQRIEVRRGNNATIEVAIVRRVIQIIRAQEPGDFQFLSRRLNREITLSARERDNAGLEDFLLRELFPERAAATR